MSGDFAEQFRGAVRRIKERADSIASQVVVEVGESLVEKSVVGDWGSWSPASQALRPMPPYVPGQFKGSWHHSFGSPSGDYTSTIDASGNSSMREIRAGAFQEPMSRHYITNNVGYALDLERGWSPQSPAGGIVGRTVLEFSMIVKRAIAKVGT